MAPFSVPSPVSSLHLRPIHSRGMADSIQIPAVVLVGVCACGVMGIVVSYFIFARIHSRQQRELRSADARYGHGHGESQGESTDIQTSLGSASLEEGARHDADRRASREDWVMELRQYAPHRKAGSDNVQRQTGGSGSGRGRVVIEMNSARERGVPVEGRAEQGKDGNQEVKHE